jgi:hypothetical protein
MAENTESDTEKDYQNLCDMIVEATIWRLEHGEPFADNELDLLLHISSEDTDRIVAQLYPAVNVRFLGLLRDRQEASAARFQEEIKKARGHRGEHDG